MGNFQHAGTKAQRALDIIINKLKKASESNASNAKVHPGTRDADRRTKFIARLVDEQTKVGHRLSSLFDRNVPKTLNI